MAVTHAILTYQDDDTGLTKTTKVDITAYDFALTDAMHEFELTEYSRYAGSVAKRYARDKFSAIVYDGVTEGARTEV